MKSKGDPHTGLMKATARSRITNRRLKHKQLGVRSLLLEGSGRSAWSRHYRDLTQLLVEDAGGIEAISELKLGLIRRVAALTVEAERLECQLADGQPVDIDVLARVSSHIRRISESIGLNRVSRDVSPTLQQIIAAHQSKAPEKPNRAPEASEATTAAADAESRTNASSPCSDDVIAEEEAT